MSHQTTTPSGDESNSRAAFEHFMSNAGANPEAIERAFYTYKQAKSANYFHVWSYCWSVREETVAALIARNAELEAQAPSALREKLRSCEEALQAVEADRDALAAENKALREALTKISDLDPADTSDGFNEWGEAWCFNASQRIANDALAPAKENDDG